VRLSLRALIVLVLLIGAPSLDRSTSSCPADAVAMITRAGGTVYYDWQVGSNGSILSTTKALGAEVACGSHWHRLFGHVPGSTSSGEGRIRPDPESAAGATGICRSIRPSPEEVDTGNVAEVVDANAIHKPLRRQGLVWRGYCHYSHLPIVYTVPPARVIIATACAGHEPGGRSSRGCPDQRTKTISAAG